MTDAWKAPVLGISLGAALLTSTYLAVSTFVPRPPQPVENFAASAIETTARLLSS